MTTEWKITQPYRLPASGDPDYRPIYNRALLMRVTLAGSLVSRRRQCGGCDVYRLFGRLNQPPRAAPGRPPAVGGGGAVVRLSVAADWDGQETRGSRYAAGGAPPCSDGRRAGLRR